METGSYVIQETLFLLGSDALKSMIENETLRPLTFTDDIFQGKTTLLTLQKIKDSAILTQPFAYIMRPLLPAHRIDPNSMLLLIIAVLGGCIMGSSIVLFRNIVRQVHNNVL